MNQEIFEKNRFYWLLEPIEEADYGWNSWDIKLKKKLKYDYGLNNRM